MLFSNSDIYNIDTDNFTEKKILPVETQRKLTFALLQLQIADEIASIYSETEGDPIAHLRKMICAAADNLQGLHGIKKEDRFEVDWAYIQLDRLKNPQELLLSERGLKRFEKIAEVGKIVASLLLDGGDKELYDDFLDDAITQSILAVYMSDADKTDPTDDGTGGED